MLGLCRDWGIRLGGLPESGAEGLVGAQCLAFAVGLVKPLIAQVRAHLGEAVLPVPRLEVLPWFS